MKELETLTSKEQSFLLGGFGSYGGYSIPFGYGAYNQYNYLYSLGFSNYVRATDDSINPGIYTTSGGWFVYSGNQGVDTYTTWGNYGSYGDLMHPIELDTVDVSATPLPNSDLTDNAVYQTMSWANQSMRTAYSHAEEMARYIGAELPAGFRVASESMGWVGVLTDTAELIEVPNWQDSVQAAAGEMLVLFAGPEVIAVGVTILIIWDIAQEA